MLHSIDNSATLFRKLHIFKELELDLRWFEVIIVLKGIFKVELALLFAFIRVNFNSQAFWDTFLCSPSFFCSFFCPPHKKCGHP